MGLVIAAVVMLGVSAESARLDANDAAMRADVQPVVCQSLRYGEQRFSSYAAARLQWAVDGWSYAITCERVRS